MLPSPPDDEPRLIRSAQSGDLPAFATLVQRHHAGVRACLAVRLDSIHDAEDLAQEVFVTAFRKIALCDPSRPMGPWLRGIAMNLLANHRRKFRPMPIGLNDELQTMLDSHLEQRLSEGQENVALDALRDCLEQFDGPSRQLINARYADGSTIEELAARLQRKTSAISMQLHRLRLLLASCIEEKIHPTSPDSTPA